MTRQIVGMAMAVFVALAPGCRRGQDTTGVPIQPPMAKQTTAVATEGDDLPIDPHADDKPMSLQQVEHVLRSRSVLPSTWDLWQRYATEAAEMSCHQAVQDREQLARGWEDLGRCQSALCEYSGAITSFDRALALPAAGAWVAGAKQEAIKRRRVAQAVLGTVPAGQQLLQMEALPFRPGGQLWAVLSGEDQKAEPRGHEFRHVQLRVVSQDPNASLRIEHVYTVKGHDACEEMSDVQLYVTDVTGDRVPDVIIGEVMYGASWTPSHLDIYEWHERALRKILGVKSDDPLDIVDLDGDGSREVINDEAVGWSMCHGKQPRWTDIYAYKNSTYRLANGEFPGEFGDLAEELRETLKEYPTDWVIWKYTGQLYEIQGRPGKALRAYRRSASYSMREIQTCDLPEFLPMLRRELAETRRRIDRLSRRH